MKLWILRPKGYNDVDNKIDPLWKPWYDKAFGFIIAAESEEEARKLAFRDAGDEEGNHWDDDAIINAWTAEHSTCVELKPGNKSEIIMKDFASA
jgi:hypothetical protein